MTDDLLQQHFSRLTNPVDDSDWLAVRRRARRPLRRVVLIAVVTAAAALLVAPPVGFGGRVLDLIQGDPAPPAVQKTFAGSNAARKQMYTFAAAAGRALHDRFSPVVPGEARGVAAIETADGPIYLWVAPTEDGRQCWMIQTGQNPMTRQPYGGGSCDGTDQTGAIRPEGPGWTDERPSVLIMHVRIYDDAITRVQLEFEGAPGMSLPVVSGHALGTMPKQSPVSLQSVVGLNADGEVVARWTHPS